MTPDYEPLFQAVKEALTRRVPAFDQVRVGRRVREAYWAGRPAPRALNFNRIAIAGAALACALALVLTLSRFAPTTFQVAGRTGNVGSSLEAQATQPLPLVFSEGSQVLLSAGSRGRVSEVTADGARVELERGSVNAQVTHRDHSRWTFVAGPFEVAVLGTQLGVSWAPEARQFELRVASGAVRVSGPLLPVGREVRTGQVVRVDLNRGLAEFGTSTTPPGTVARAAEPGTPATEPGTPATEPGTPATEPGTPAASLPLPAAPATSASGPALASAGGEVQRPAWVALAAAGKHGDAVAAAQRTGLPAVYRTSSSESLLDLARAARLSGHPDVERAALLACRKQARGQPPAAQAAYLLGRASAPAEAVTWFETYIREQPRGLLAREAAGRLIESYVASRNASGAKQAATSYLAEYPLGPHAAMARRVLGSAERP